MTASIQSTQISFYVIFLSISLASIFFFKVNSTETTSFSITKFTNQQNLIFQGSAYTSNEKLTLTGAVKNIAGRALYSAPIHIWDSKTGNVADFTTSFTFVINGGSSFFADGLTFFIAPVDTKLGSDGGYLGVFNGVEYDKTIKTVAVEFDTFYNTAWDPSSGDRHIGIDVNSIKSISTTTWILQHSREANVVISFKATTNVLTVTLTYPDSTSYIHSDVVALKDIVPEWARVGFSASTGLEFSTHEVLSWSFHSELGGTSSSNLVAAA